MRRVLLIAVLTCLAGGGTAAAATPLAARLKACTTGLTAARRSAVFSASMPRIKGAAALSLRFDLLERRPGGAFVPLADVPRFGVWERSKPNVAGFVFDKRVAALVAPAAYRVRVQYRWLAADDRVVRHAERLSPVCDEPDLRPDLEVAAVVAGPVLASGRRRYFVSIRNAGLGDSAITTQVGLAVDGAPQMTQPARPLASGELTTVTFDADRCRPGRPVQATADARGEVDEADETDDDAVLTCPDAG